MKKIAKKRSPAVMKVWITRDKEPSDTTDLIEFWREEPTLALDHNFWHGSKSRWGPVALCCKVFRRLTGRPLPRKGSKTLVEVELTIKDAKKAR